jgi:TolB-like protein
MTEPLPEAAEAEPLSKEQAASAPSPDLWERIKDHKVLQWSLTYFGASLALAHAQDLLSHTYHWPELVGRLLIGVLIVGFPVALAVAWYHGHKGLKQISAGEMTVISIMILIGAGLLIVLVRAPAEPASPLQVHEGLPPPATSVANEVGADNASAPETASIPQASAPQASIAVVPFANLTGDASKEYFSDGMAEEMINSLAQVPGLKVPARTSSFAYKGRNIDIRRIAQDLGVATILEGSVRSAGERIRVTAQLVDAKSGFHMWSQSYDRQFADIFKLQDDLAAAIVQALQSKLNIAVAAPAVSAPPTQDLEAYRLYLQANSIPRTTEESFHRALDLYQQSVMRDPHFARALSAMANLHLFFIRWGYAMPDALESAEREATQALTIDPHLAEAQGVLGVAHATRGQWVEAEKAFRQALALNQADPETHSAHAVLVSSVAGHLRDALQEAALAYRDAPANQIVVLRLAATQDAIGLDSDALHYANLAIDLGYNSNLEPITGIREGAALRAGRYAEAANQAVLNLSGAERLAGYENAVRLSYAALADPAKKAAAIAALRSLSAVSRAPALFGTADLLYYFIYTLLGAPDEAYAAANALLDNLEHAGTLTPNAWRAMWAPEMAPFRKDPRFQAFVTRLGLMDYWKQYGPPDDCDLKDGKITCR